MLYEQCKKKKGFVFLFMLILVLFSKYFYNKYNNITIYLEKLIFHLMIKCSLKPRTHESIQVKMSKKT
jgi:hypothetical protein